MLSPKIDWMGTTGIPSGLNSSGTGGTGARSPSAPGQAAQTTSALLCEIWKGVFSTDRGVRCGRTKHSSKQPETEESRGLNLSKLDIILKNQLSALYWDLNTL